MPSRKRPSVQAAEGDGDVIDRTDGAGDDAGQAALLRRVRKMWQFANFCQWIYIFGRAAKIDESIDVEEIEAGCLRPDSTLLADLALAVLKLVSSHRGLTHDILDEQMRKQYQSKAPNSSPFGDDVDPHRFSDFDVFTKIKVLQQLTQWAMIHPERLRDKMEEQKDTEQATWRIEPYGWDREDRTYYVLDDNRVYRLTEPPLPKARPRPKKSKTGRSGRRSSKRQRAGPATTDAAADTDGGGDVDVEPADDGLGGRVWECVAVTLQEVRELLETLVRTRDENEKVLRRQLEMHLVPILEKQEEAQKRKELQRERELVNLAKMANAKRSSRIAGKAERWKQEEKEREEDQQQREAEAARRREEQQRVKMEKDRDFRMFSRQRRLQEREARRLQHEEELAQLSEDSRNAFSAGRMSERRLQAEIERNRRALKDLEQEEEDWVFDCACGLYGQVDDGTHSVACEKCNVWQHSKCLGISEEEADRPEFHFVCEPCRRRDEVTEAPPRSTIKIKLHQTGSSGVRPRPAEQPAVVCSLGLPPVAGHGAYRPQPEKSPLAAQPLRPGTARQAPSPMAGDMTCQRRRHLHLPIPTMPTARPSTSRYYSPEMQMPTGPVKQGQAQSRLLSCDAVAAYPRNLGLAERKQEPRA